MSDQPAIVNRDVLERALREPLSSKLETQFARYLALVLAENERAGLTSLDRADAIVERHFAESVALLSLMREHAWTAPILEDGARLADIGSGGGFPGVPMRLVEPALQLTMPSRAYPLAETVRSRPALLLALGHQGRCR